ncbi:uncharacterized protein [Littorina saxatilis]|uniref:Voltage-gated hydrogen channel 1 n=1 Tax=Littorina saxatilis TaxID=31220 RepID=A0AAN9G823_9CAEN
MTSTKEYVQRDDAGGGRRQNRKKGKGRCRKRLSTLLHTHVALILVCTLAALDSACVIGQIICDILIMKETLHEWEVLDENLTSILWKELPLLNVSADDPANLNLEKIRDILLEYQLKPHGNFSSIPSSLVGSGVMAQPAGGFDPRWLQFLQSAAASAQLPGHDSGSVNVSIPLASGDSSKNLTAGEMIIGFFKIPVAHHRGRRAAGAEAEGEHTLLHDLTHSFHLGSMIILSMLLLETLLKVFAMGKKILHHKLEIFDAFVVSVSWALDVAFWEGIWAHPGTEAATILIFILPWRVVRIVNSFVLVIQEKDHVQLKIVKQRLRLSVKKSKESTRKASSYRTEVKQLQGLCRKYGAIETEIGACGPPGRSGRRRSSLMPAMERAASLTLISALGSHPSLYTMGSSSDDDDGVTNTGRELTRTVSPDHTLRSAFSVSTLDSVFTIEGKIQGDGYLTSDNEDDKDSTADGLDNAVFVVAGDEELDSSLNADNLKDAEKGRVMLANRLHARLTEQDSDVTVISELSTSSGGGSDPYTHEIPPHYHEVVSKQDSNTRL